MRAVSSSGSTTRCARDGVFLTQAHLFDVDTIPEAVDLIPCGVVDGFAYFEATTQWSIHAKVQTAAVRALRTSRSLSYPGPG